MKNFIQDGETITVTAPADVASGAVVIVGSIVGIAAFTALSGAEVEVQTEGIFELTKVTTDVVAVGDKLYFDPSLAKLTKTAGTGSKPLVGYAVSAAANGVTIVRVSVQPTMATGPA